MTKREIASLACKLLSIYAALNALSSLQGTVISALSMWNFASSRTGGNSANASWLIGLAGFAPCVALLLAALLLWMLADFVAVLMTRSSAVDTTPVATIITAREWQTVGFSLFGVWELLQAVASIGRLTYNFFMQTNSSSSAIAYFKWNATGEIALTTVHFLLGCALLLGARRLSNLLNIARD